MNQFGKFAEKIGILVQGGTVNVGQIRLDGEMSRQEFRNRKALLNNVRNAWVEGVLEKSLHEQIPIVLGLENRPIAVASPWNMDIINPDDSCQPLPAGTPVVNVFDKLGEGGTLLILGEPGAGKTITLLQLARDLIAHAEEKIDRRIPVVLNLSSWAAEKQTIAKWIVEELNSKYQVNRKIGQQWIEKQELLLLLDGLDEIRHLEKRNACVTALNAFQQEQATEMVVCCRVRDYEELGDRLKLQSALVLQPLTNEQIHAYLDLLKSNLTVLKTLLIEDVTLQELAHSPLLLNIMVFAYQGIEVADIPVSTIASNRKKQLFDDYINRIFQGSRTKGYLSNLQCKDKYRYSRQNTTRWLIWLAQKMVQHPQTIFLIEKMQPYWLNIKEIKLYRTVTYLFFGWIDKQVLNIKPVESVIWSRKKFEEKSVQISVKTGEVGAVIATIICVLTGNFKAALVGAPALVGYIPGWIIGLVVAIGLGFVELEIADKTYPNQGIRESAINALRYGLVLGVIFGLILGLMFGIIIGVIVAIFFGQIWGWNKPINAIATFLAMILGWIITQIVGVLLGVLYFGGWASIKHLILRLILYFTGHIPWNYAKFLDWASDKLFLQKVGGGYIFIHRSLMEHFAEMENG